jgi:hypothetical protein
MEMIMARPRKILPEPAAQPSDQIETQEVTQEVTPQVVIVEHTSEPEPELPASVRAELEAGRAALAKLRG